VFVIRVRERFHVLRIPEKSKYLTFTFRQLRKYEHIPAGDTSGTAFFTAYLPAAPDNNSFPDCPVLDSNCWRGRASCEANIEKPQGSAGRTKEIWRFMRSMSETE
jgi:hypothetical protein